MPAAAEHLVFEHLGSEQGLSHPLINAIFQDQQGFLWLGTMDGLDRFDGYSFTIFRNDPKDAKSISHNFVNAITQDASGNIWIGTEWGGLNCYNHLTGEFTHFTNDKDRSDSISNNQVYSLWIDRQNRIWSGTAAGLNCLDMKTLKFQRYSLTATQENIIINAIQPSLTDNDILWLGTTSGLIKFSVSNGSFTCFSQEQRQANSLIDDYIYCLYESPREPGVLWLGTVGGLDRFQVNPGQFRHFLHNKKNAASINNNRIRRIFEDKQGILWIGTDGGGLNRFERTKGTFTSYSNDPKNITSLSQNTVLSILEDNTGILWLGTSGGGLNKVNFQKSQFVLTKNEPGNPNSLQMNDILAIHPSRSEPGIIWVGNQDGGLNRLDRNSGKVRHFLHDPLNINSLSHNSIYAIHETRDGKLWLGTMNGLNYFDPVKNRFRSYFSGSGKNGLPGNFVLTICEDRQNYLWLGTRKDGMARMDSMKGEFTTFKNILGDPQSLSSNSVLVILPSSRENDIFWIGTYNGLNRYDALSHAWKRFYFQSGNDSNKDRTYIMHICESLKQSSILWIATDDGLLRFDSVRGSFSQIKTGLPGNLVYAIIPILNSQEKEYLWLSTNNGLCRYQPRSGEIKNFGIQDGVKISDFNRGAFTRTQAGELFFGGTLGMQSFFPDKIRDNLRPPIIAITSLKINEKEITTLPSILAKGEIDLPFNRNFLAFEFTALDFTNPEKNRFAYRMKGLDKEWVNRGSDRRFAIYTDIRPGEYLFQVKGCNNDGVWNKEGVSLKIIIDPPFWQTWWFRVLTGLFVFMVIYFLFSFRLRKIKARKEELEKLVAEKTRELKEISLVDPLTGLSNRRFISEIIHPETRTFVSFKKHLLKSPDRRQDNENQVVFGVFILDIDHFKAVNDQYGHEAGDLVLKTFSTILKGMIRANDFLVRLGGEEFLIVLRKTIPEYVHVFAEKVRVKVANTPFIIGSESSPVLKKTCSIGYVYFPFNTANPGLLTLEQTIMLADLGLFQAKDSGRNRTVFLQPGEKQIPDDQLPLMLSSLKDGLANKWLRIETTPKSDRVVEV